MRATTFPEGTTFYKKCCLCLSPIAFGVMFNIGNYERLNPFDVELLGQQSAFTVNVREPEIACFYLHCEGSLFTCATGELISNLDQDSVSAP